MKVTTFCKAGVTLGAAALLVGGLAVPAMADPATGSFGTLVGLGSDTTQDVVNGLATAIGGNQIASYDATNAGPSVVTRSGGIAIPRTSGSGAGRDELLVAIGALASKSGVALADGSSATITSNVVGQIDFARSSGGPGSSDTNAQGVVTYVPFARDAVDVAYSSTLLAKVPFFVGSNNDPLTAPSLYRIYTGDVQYVYFNADNSYNSAGKTADAAPQGTTAYKLQPLLPKFGSGTRSYFMGQLGITDSSGFAASSPVVKDTDNGTAIEEHNGQAIADYTTANTLAIAPFSISQWVSQANGVPGVTDRRHGALLASLSKADGAQVAPTTGSGTSYATNPSYAAMVRDVYNIVPSRLADDSSSAIAKTFVGSDSLVCKQTAVITKYGFLPEPGTTPASTCGYAQLRAYAASTSTTTLAVPANGSTGSTLKASVSVASNGNGGGVVNILEGTTTVGTAKITTGGSTVDVSVTPTVAGAHSYTAQFIPALGGVASSTSSAQPVDVAQGATTSSTTISVPSLTAGKTATVTATVKGGSTAGGTVKLYSGSTLVKSATVAAGATSAKLAFVPIHATYSLKAVYTPKDATATTSTSAVKAVKVAKGSSAVAVGTIATTKSTKGAAVRVHVTATGAVATGTVTIKEGSKVLISKKALDKDGRIAVTLPKLKVGTHKLTVSYSGSSVWNTSSKTVSFKVVK